jgi:hypothetical protein
VSCQTKKAGSGRRFKAPIIAISYFPFLGNAHLQKQRRRPACRLGKSSASGPTQVLDINAAHECVNSQTPLWAQLPAANFSYRAIPTRISPRRCRYRHRRPEVFRANLLAARSSIPIESGCARYRNVYPFQIARMYEADIDVPVESLHGAAVNLAPLRAKIMKQYSSREQGTAVAIAVLPRPVAN